MTRRAQAGKRDEAAAEVSSPLADVTRSEAIYIPVGKDSLSKLFVFIFFFFFPNRCVPGTADARQI